MRKIAFLLMLVALVAAFAVPAAAQDDDMMLPEFIQHSECEQDLSGQNITIYHFGDISAAYASITQPLLAGLADAISYFNERGGACGATFSTDNRDTAGQPERTQEAYDYYSSLEDTPDLLILYASSDSELLRTQLAEDEIPVLISAGSLEGLYGEDAMEPGWVFATNPLYADQLATFCDYVAANPDTFADPAIGYMAWAGTPGVSAFGQAAYTEPTIAYCESVGVPIVGLENFTPIDTDVSGQIENLADAGANIIYVNALATGPVVVARSIDFLGMNDELTLASVNWGLDTSVAFVGRADLGDDGLPLVDGMYGSLPFRWWSELEIPGIQFINEQADLNERNPISERNIAYLLGWATVDTYIELYTQTANRLGTGDVAEITGPDIKETIENLVYSPLGLYEMDYQGGAIRALPGNRIAQLRFLNQAGDGPAASADEAAGFDVGDGTTFYFPILVPLSEFGPAPDMRPGMMDDM
jgi:ABC-type branched-subunit amino acid transport system substrate-binding protein